MKIANETFLPQILVITTYIQYCLVDAFDEPFRMYNSK